MILLQQKKNEVQKYCTLFPQGIPNKYLNNNYIATGLSLNFEIKARQYDKETFFVSDIYKVEVQDATGAGDCYAAGFVAGLLEGRSLEDAAKMAAACGALNCAAFGPMEGKISPEAVWKMIEENEKQEKRMGNPLMRMPIFKLLHL